VDERTRLFLWLLFCGGFFALLGGAFGAVTGYATWREGRAAGGFVGLTVARAFARLRDEPLSGSARAALVGAVDGAVFGLLVGVVVGLATGWPAGGEWRRLRPVLLGGVLLAAGALALGSMAVVIGGGGMRSVLGLFAGGVLGAVVGLWLGALDGLFAGLLLGAGAGALLARAGR
jgi:hypothetical protein